MTLTYKVGDRRPALEAVLSDRDGPVDLSGATVTFQMRRRGSSDVHLSEAANIIDTEAALVRYEWQDGDLSNPGNFDNEFIASWPDGNSMTFPNDSYGRIHVMPRLSNS